MLCCILCFFFFYASLVAASWFMDKVYRTGPNTVSTVLFGCIECEIFTSLRFVFFFIFCDNFIVPSKLCLFGKIQCFFSLVSFIQIFLTCTLLWYICTQQIWMGEKKHLSMANNLSVALLCTFFLFFFFHFVHSERT